MGSRATTTSRTGNKFRFAKFINRIVVRRLGGFVSGRNRWSDALARPIQTRPRRPSSRRVCMGFTLIELVMVCAVLALLVAISVPRFSRTGQRLRVEQVAFECTQLLRLAHERAVSESREARWIWDEDTRRARIEVEPDGAAGSPEPAAAAGSRMDATGARVPDDLLVALTRQEAPVECQCVRFFPDGTSEATTLMISAREQLYTVTLDAATSNVLLSAGAAAR